MLTSRHNELHLFVRVSKCKYILQPPELYYYDESSFLEEDEEEPDNEDDDTYTMRTPTGRKRKKGPKPKTGSKVSLLYGDSTIVKP